VTLDPTTAHPNLHLSQDLQEARGQLTPQVLGDNPTRFDYEPCVLGLQGFSKGRHFWEVDVGQGGGVWSLGVARGSIKRKGPLSFTPKEGVWALGSYHNLSPPKANQGLQPLPRRIQVFLDYEGGRVSFYSPGGDDPILVFPQATFHGEKIFPWF
ncbi:Zinc-binding protein A33, partial [Chaetura pelagica]